MTTCADGTPCDLTTETPAGVCVCLRCHTAYRGGVKFGKVATDETPHGAPEIKTPSDAGNVSRAIQAHEFGKIFLDWLAREYPDRSQVNWAHPILLPEGAGMIICTGEENSVHRHAVDMNGDQRMVMLAGVEWALSRAGLHGGETPPRVVN